VGRGQLQRYLVEVYHSGLCAEELPEAAVRARAAARELTDEGRPVRYLRATFVPEDETCFYLYEAATAGAVEEASKRAGISHGRIVEAVQVGRAEGN
jgi:hypothetical protein